VEVVTRTEVHSVLEGVDAVVRCEFSDYDCTPCREGPELPILEGVCGPRTCPHDGIDGSSQRAFGGGARWCLTRNYRRLDGIGATRRR